MSKLGDLIVRLRLQYDDYKKGLKKADADTKTFAGTLGKIKGVGLAVWGAIGGAVTAMAKQFINHSQLMGDKWNQLTGRMKSAWNQFLTTVTSHDWEGFGQRIRNAMSAAGESITAHDAEYEVGNAIKLRRAAMAEELADLQILMRDTSKSYKVRAKAAEDYLAKVAPLYQAEIDLRKRIYMTDTSEYLKNAGLADTADNRDLLRSFFTDIAPNEKLMEQLVNYTNKNIGKKSFGKNAWHLSAQDSLDIDAFFREYGTKAGAVLATLANYYQNTNDAAADKAISAIEGYDAALAAFREENRKVFSVQNSAQAGIDKEGWSVDDLDKVKSAHEIAFKLGQQIASDLRKLDEEFSLVEDLDIDLSDIDAEMDAFLDSWQAGVEEVMQLNQMLEDSIIQATTGGMQAFTDMLMGIEGADATDILAALLQPFANTATQLGSLLLAEGLAIKAFKDSLTGLNPAVAIGAGLALIALGTALGSAIKALGNGGSAASPSNGGYNSGGSSSPSNYESTLTVEVVGRISGPDIVVSGQKTQDKWNR